MHTLTRSSSKGTLPEWLRGKSRIPNSIVPSVTRSTYRLCLRRFKSDGCRQFNGFFFGLFLDVISMPNKLDLNDLADANNVPRHRHVVFLNRSPVAGQRCLPRESQDYPYALMRIHGVYVSLPSLIHGAARLTVMPG